MSEMNYLDREIKHTFNNLVDVHTGEPVTIMTTARWLYSKGRHEAAKAGEALGKSLRERGVPPYVRLEDEDDD